MAQLNDFIAQVKSEGLMRNNRYIVTMEPPSAIQPLFGKAQVNKTLLFCDSASIPGVTISTSPALTYGEIREMPYEKLFTPANFTFYVDNAMIVKHMFDKWQGLIVNPTTRNTGYYVDYTVPIDIAILDVYRNERYIVTLHEAYVKDIGQIQMDASNRDVMKLNVTMQYKYWTSAPSTSSISYPDNRGFFEKIFDAFFGDSQIIPDNYFGDFNGFQSQANNITTPQLGGLDLAGAAYKF